MRKQKSLFSTTFLSSTTADQKQALCNLLRSNSRVSLHGNEQLTGISKSTIYRIFMHDLGVFPFNLQIGTQFLNADEQARVQYDHYSLSKLQTEQDFL